MLLVIVAPGCGGGGDFDLVPVSGTVTMDGRPLADANVVFHPQFGRPSSGKTAADGRYVLQYTAEQDGAVPGTHRVSISTYIEADGDSSDPLVQRGRSESIPARYNAETTLTVELQAGHKQPINFPLESQGTGQSASR